MIANRMLGLLVLAVLALTPADGGAQRARLDRQPPPGGRPPGGRPLDGQLEQRVQERIVRVMRDRLQLDDAQIRQLRDVNERLAGERASVRRDEFELRTALRRELLLGDSASNDRVAALLERWPSIERRRIDLLEREQRELSAFLTPVQRARYIGLQEEIRRGLEELQQRRREGGRGGPPGGPPPGGRPPDDRTSPDVW